MYEKIDCEKTRSLAEDKAGIAKTGSVTALDLRISSKQSRRIKLYFDTLSNETEHF